MNGREEWVTVRSGSMMEMLACRGELEARGIPTFLPDENTKIFDPFITGAGSLSVELRVPRSAAQEAEVLLAENVEELDRPPRSEEEEALRELDRLGRRIGFAGLTILLAPYGLWLAVRYFIKAGRLDQRPPGYGYAVAGTALCCAMVSLYVLMGFVT
jgi:hypothetical protein